MAKPLNISNDDFFDCHIIELEFPLEVTGVEKGKCGAFEWIMFRIHVLK